MPATAADPVQLVLDHLPNYRSAGDGKWTAKCPNHDDNRASLGVAVGDDGRVLLHCRAGCEPTAVCRAMGLTLADLFPRDPDNGRPHPAVRLAPRRPAGVAPAAAGSGRVVATYDYIDPLDGTLLFQKVRLEPKAFRQRRPDGQGGWTYKLDGVPRVLYRLVDLNDADHAEWVLVVEGEKAADRLASAGAVATCTSEGAGKWRDAYTEALRGRRVAILADNDDPGRAHAAKVAAALLGTAAEVRVIELPGLPVKGDVYDYLDAGHTLADLAAVVEATPAYAQPQATPDKTPPEAGHTGTGGGTGMVAQSWTEAHNARQLVRRFGRSFRWHHDRGTYLTYDPTAGQWAEDATGQVCRQAKAIAASAWDGLGDLSPAERREAIAHATRSETARGIAAMLTLARSEPGVTVRSAELDADPWVLNVANGVVDLHAGRLRDHGPELLMTRVAPVVFDPEATCPTFLAFLDRIMAGDADLIGYLQRVFGLCLTGDISVQELFVFWGSGANGKSVLCDTFAGLLGEYAGLAPPALLTMRSNDEHPTEIADLQGRRCVFGSETEEGAKLRIQLVKRLTGDAKLKARYMRQDYFEFARTFKLILATNNRPTITEGTNAIWRRLRLVPFRVVIPEAERDPT